MALSLSANLASLESKILTLVAQRDDALAKLEEMTAANLRLQEKLEKTNKELQQSRIETEFLTVSHKLADNPDSLARARTDVRRMLARVEKAIALLEDDARI